MKTTTKKIIFTILELVFIAVIPIILVIWNYSNIGNSAQALNFKIGMTGIMLIMFILIFLKKIYLDKYNEQLFQQENNLLSDLRIENDLEKLNNIVRELKGIRTIRNILSSIFPIIFMAIIYIACLALEARLIKLSGVVGLIAISYVIGTIFGIFSAREIKVKNKEKMNEKDS